MVSIDFNWKQWAKFGAFTGVVVGAVALLLINLLLGAIGVAFSITLEQTIGITQAALIDFQVVAFFAIVLTYTIAAVAGRGLLSLVRWKPKTELFLAGISIWLGKTAINIVLKISKMPLGKILDPFLLALSFVSTLFLVWIVIKLYRKFVGVVPE